MLLQARCELPEPGRGGQGGGGPGDGGQAGARQQSGAGMKLVFSPHLQYSSFFTGTGAAGAGQEEEEEWGQGDGQQAGQNVQLNRSGLSFVPKIFNIY